MPNGTLFKLELVFSPIHIDAKSISAKLASPGVGTDLSQLTEEEDRITNNIVAAIRRLADIIETQGLDQHEIYGLSGGKTEWRIGEYFCRFRPE